MCLYKGRPKRRASTSSGGRVLTTSSAIAPPRRAVATASSMFLSPRVEWASVFTTIATPASRPSRTCSSRRSSRSGRPFTSTARPCSASCANTTSRSTAFGGRWLINRPVGWLRQLTYGDSSAVSTRLVSSSRKPLVGLRDLLALPAHPVRVEARHRADRDGVIADREVVVPALARGQAHLVDGSPSVRPGRVGVQVAPHVNELEQVRRLATELALPKLRR